MGVTDDRRSPWDLEFGRERRPAQPAFDQPHPLRMRDHLLGGKDNYRADRDAVEATLALYPDLKELSQAGAAFLNRAIARIADPAHGLTQFLHFGAFIPTRHSYDGQVRAQCPDAVYVYVTDDPVSAAHARGVLAAQARPRGAVYVQVADFRDPAPVLRGGWLNQRLDLNRPVGVLLVGMLDFIADDEQLALALAGLRVTLAPGSLIVMQHALDLPNQDAAVKARQLLGPDAFQFTTRPLSRVRELLADFDFVDPGVVPCTSWHPDGEGPGPEFTSRCAIAGGVARI